MWQKLVVEFCRWRRLWGSIDCCPAIIPRESMSNENLALFVPVCHSNSNLVIASLYCYSQTWVALKTLFCLNKKLVFTSLVESVLLNSWYYFTSLVDYTLSVHIDHVWDWLHTMHNLYNPTFWETQSAMHRFIKIPFNPFVSLTHVLVSNKSIPTLCLLLVLM